MKRCSNSHKACPGYVNAPGYAKCHYCVDCYSAWQSGGEAAVTASIAERTKLTLAKHECVDTAQITALQAEVAEYAAFKAEVVELYTFRFRGNVHLPDPDALLDRIRADRMIAGAARTSMSRDIPPVPGLPLKASTTRTIEWLKGLEQRLKFREAVGRAEARGQCCHGAYVAVPRQSVDNKHPSARQPVELDLSGRKQLDRIESLAKLSATYSPFWPHTYGVLLGAALASTYLLW